MNPVSNAQLALQYIPLIHRIARCYHIPSCSCLEYDDLVQEGYLGVLDGLNHLKEAPTVVYLSYWIRKYIRLALLRYGSAVSLPEPRGCSHDDPEQQQISQSHGSVSLDRVLYCDDGDPVTFADMQADSSTPYTLLTERDQYADLYAAIDSLPERMQIIIRATYGLPSEALHADQPYPVLTNAQLADLLGISQSLVRKLRERALHLLRAKCLRSV